MVTSETSNLPEPMREGRVLVVDLEPPAGQLIRWILAEEGLAVDLEPSAPAALTRVAWGRPALVLLSLPVGFPRRAVVGFAADLQRVGGGRVPLLLLDRASWTGEEVRQAGAVGFLPKPFKGIALVDAVWRALSPAPRG
jgi:DNA-binding response OmpR family regulator